MRRGHGGTGAQTHRWVALLAALVVAGCELREVTVPLGAEQVAVHGMLTLDSAVTMQYVIVERTATGTADLPAEDSLRGVPVPPLPVIGASVTVTRDDGARLEYEPTATPGVYGVDNARARPLLAPGREYSLHVVLADGREVRGRTRIPAFPLVSGLPAPGAGFDRDRDTLRLTWTGAEGTAEVYVQVRPRDLRRRVTLALFTDSAFVTLPGAMPLPVIGDTLPPSVWVAGTYQTVTVAAIDTNYFDHIRSGNDPFTGGGFLNHLEGGIGVFGATAPVYRRLAVRGAMDHPYEGRYGLRMLAAGDSLVGELELFVTRETPEPVLVSGLVTAVGGAASSQVRSPLSEVEASGVVRDGVLRLRVIAGGERELGILEGAFSATGTTVGTARTASGGPAGGFALVRLP